MLEPIYERRHLIPFRSQLLPSIFTDVLVVGSGVAALSLCYIHIEQNDLFLDVTASCVPHDLMKAFQCDPALNMGLWYSPGKQTSRD